MKNILLALITLAACTTSALADVYVSGYQRKDGTYVQPHYRSSPNNTPTDNFSYKGNTNPYHENTVSKPYYEKPKVDFYAPSRGQYNINPFYKK